MPFLYSRYSFLCALFSLGLGLLVLAGWYLKIPLLIQVHPSFVPMQYNTALGFLFCGTGLFFLTQGKPTPALALGSLALAVGGLTLIQYLFVINIGLDELFMNHFITVKTLHPGRMAPNTALCFSLVGSSLLISGLSGKRSSTRIALFALSALTLALSAVATLGYIIGMETAYGWGRLTRMALHTSIGFLVLGSGIFILSWINSQTTQLSTWWRPVLATTCLIIVSLLLYRSNIIHENILIKNKIQSATDFLNNKISNSIQSRVLELSRMGKRWETSKNVSYKNWKQDATEYIKHFSPYQSIQWVDSTGKVRWVVPSIKNTPKGLSQIVDENQKTTMMSAKSRKKPSISPIIKLDQEEYGFSIIIPIFRPSQFDGYLVANISTNDFLNFNFDTNLKQDFSFRLYSKGKMIFENKKNSTYHDPFWQKKSFIKVDDNKWKIVLWPNSSLIEKSNSPVSLVILLAGILTSFLIGFIIYLIQRERKQTATLRRITDRNRLILESVGDGIYGLDTLGNMSFSNAATGKFLGYSPEELVGRNQHDLIHHTRANGTSFPKEECSIHASYVQGKTTLVNDEVFWRKDGTSFPIEYLSTPIFENNKITGAVVVFRDITERKKAEEELNQFAYVISHDLKAPLRGIKNLASWIQEDLNEIMSEEIKENFDLLVKRTISMENMITGLLEYSRAGRVFNKVQSVNVQKLINEIADLLGVSDKEIVSPPEPLPTLTTDKIRMQQVFQNLIDNAIKHHPNKENIRIEIGCQEEESYYNFSVSDNGSGINPTHFEKIFQMFHTLKSREHTGNTGLGLALIKRIIETQGGKITVASKQGGGTTFHFSWPKEIEEGKL